MLSYTALDACNSSTHVNPTVGSQCQQVWYKTLNPAHTMCRCLVQYGFTALQRRLFNSSSDGVPKLLLLL